MSRRATPLPGRHSRLRQSAHLTSRSTACDRAQHPHRAEARLPENADFFTARERDFEDRVYRALYGDSLVTILGGQTLADLDRQGKLFEFLNQRRYKARR